MNLGTFLAEGPFVAVYLFLLMVVFLRAQGTYWLARWATELAVKHAKPEEGWRKRAIERLDSPSMRKGTASIHKWGLPVIPFSFLTVGFQSVVIAAAGFLRLPWWKFTLAMFPGILAWALIYSTIGFAVWGAAIAAAAGSPWGIAGMVSLAVAIVAAVVVRRRRKSRQPAAVPLAEEDFAAAGE
ncbi:MAG TPA: VTT domain-containing protein [Actinomycetaceae bacterium]|nr:VTT domain-containing protein [Actinomycetaceae bacterium]